MTLSGKGASHARPRASATRRCGASVLWSLALLAWVAACRGEGSDGDESVEGRLCRQVAGCDLLPETYDLPECRDVLGRCTRDLGPEARVQWEGAVEHCLMRDGCDELERCYLDVPGC